MRLKGKHETPFRLEEFLVGIQAAVFARVVERNIGVRAPLAQINLARIERLGINVNANGALVKFGQVFDLVDGLDGIHVGGVSGIQIIGIGGDDFAGAVSSVALVHAVILDAEAADGSGHPTILAAMIVNAAVLADVPANGHALEDVVPEDEIASVIAFGKEKILVEGLRADGVADDVVLHVL